MTTTNLLVIEANRVQSLSVDPIRQELTWRAAAGLPKPVTVLDVVAALGDEPTPADILSEMADDLDSLEPEWLEAHLACYQRAGAVEQMRGALEQVGRARAARHWHTDSPARFGLVAGPVQAALDRLAVVAKALPAGPAALRPEANIDAGTTPDLAEARDLLKRIGQMLGALRIEIGAQRMNRWAVALLDVPAVEPARFQRFNATLLNPSAERDAVQEAARYDDTDLLVVDTLRGGLPPLSLRLVTSRAELAERAEHVHAAHLVVTEERR